MSFKKLFKLLAASASYDEPKLTDAYAWRVMDENRHKIRAEPVTNEEFKAALRVVTNEIAALRKRAKSVERKSLKDEAKWKFDAAAHAEAVDVISDCDALTKRAEIVCDQYMMGRGKVELVDKYSAFIEKIEDVGDIADEARRHYEEYRDEPNPFD